MANFTHKKTETEKVVIKGTLSENGKVITVTEKENEKDVTVQDYLDKFKGLYVEMTLSTKSEDDLLDKV